MRVYLLRLRTAYCPTNSDGIIGIFGTYETAEREGKARYHPVSDDGLVCWQIDTWEIDDIPKMLIPNE